MTGSRRFRVARVPSFDADGDSDEDLKELGISLGHRRILTAAIADLAKAVDVICVFAPNFARLDIMREIAKAVEGGAKLKGIIVEKPLARNLKEADTLVRMAKALHIPTAYFENQIHMPAIVQARTQLEQVEKAMGAAHLARSAEEIRMHIEHGAEGQGERRERAQQGPRTRVDQMIVMLDFVVMGFSTHSLRPH